MKNLGYYNGIIGPLENMSIPMLDRAVYFGDGVYDVVYTENYNPIYLQEHVDRLYKNAEVLKINPPVDKNELITIILDLIKKLDSGDLQIYFQFSRGSGIREHAFDGEIKANLMIMITIKQILGFKKVSCITMPDTRFYHCNLKTLNLIPSVLGAIKAKESGAYETIFHRNGRITECSHSNIHIIKGNKFYTSPNDNLILPGISRKHLIEKMQCNEFEIIYEPFYLDDLFSADKVILTAAGAPYLEVCEIDGKKIGG